MDKSKLSHLLSPIFEPQNNSTPKIVMLVGNKSDMESERAVETEEAEAFCAQQKLLFIETAAVDAKNVDSAFQQLVSEMFLKASEREVEDEKDSGPKRDISVATK